MIILRITGRFRYPPDATNLDQCEASRIFLLRRLSRDLSRRSAKHEAGSGGIYIAWGVSPRDTIEENSKPRSGDRQLDHHGFGSRRNRGLSPLQGSGVL